MLLPGSDYFVYMHVHTYIHKIVCALSSVFNSRFRPHQIPHDVCLDIGITCSYLPGIWLEQKNRTMVNKCIILHHNNS